jgi:hypothetical protein
MVFLEGNHYYNHSSPTKAADFLHGMSKKGRVLTDAPCSAATMSSVRRTVEVVAPG